MTLRVLDLFSGIGGFSLGLERAGMRTAAFCEADPFCRRVLAKHWPEVPCYDDVRTLGAGRLAADGISVDVMCGGFPCQDISGAGRGGGLSGARSGLWFEYQRLIGECRPAWVLIENVSLLRSRGLDEVLRGLSALGYDAEWHCVPAAAVGAPHRRDRIWIVAHATRERRGEARGLRPNQSEERPPCGGQAGRDVADANGVTGEQGRPGDAAEGARGRDADRGGVGQGVAHANGARLEVVQPWLAGELSAALGACSWPPEPDVGRVAYGIPARVDRLRCLGNAVVPQIPELIGRAILAAENKVSDGPLPGSALSIASIGSGGCSVHEQLNHGDIPPCRNSDPLERNA